jgi:glyoxylase-like metal-dependent hydrolase (beta-lactamase superfamily II)
VNHSPWTDLGGGLLVRQSAAFDMNATLLLDSEHAVLVDPGILPGEIDDLAARVSGARPTAITLVFTHPHWDHVLARPWWPEARTLAHDGFQAQLRKDPARVVSKIEALCRTHGESWTRGFAPFAPDEAVSGLHFTRFGPWRTVIRDAPGHCSSQISLHLPDRTTLIAADMLSDIEIPLLDGPCAPYLRTLRDLVPLAEGGAIETVIPGHGSIARGQGAVMERLHRDRDYLERLEREVGAALRGGKSKPEAGEQLADLEYAGAALAGPNREAHLRNVEFAYDGLAAGRSRPGGSRRR